MLLLKNSAAQKEIFVIKIFHKVAAKKQLQKVLNATSKEQHI
jgi:hypothetical protein